MALLTVILEVHDHRHGQMEREEVAIAAAQGKDVLDYYAIYIGRGPAESPCWRWSGISWEPWP